MSYAINDTQHDILEHIVGISTYTLPTSLYLALYTVKPGEDGTGGTEVSGGSYAREEIGKGASNWSRTNESVSNDNAITFTVATASWGTLVAWAICDAASAGNILYVGDFNPNKQVDNNDELSVAIGEIVISIA